MIYFYNIKLCFYKNNEKIINEYLVSFAEIIDFLYYKKQHNSSVTVFSIKPHYSRRNLCFSKRKDIL